VSPSAALRADMVKVLIDWVRGSERVTRRRDMAWVTVERWLALVHGEIEMAELT
jgi:hypothetical protein